MSTILADIGFWGGVVKYATSLTGLPFVYGICALVGGGLFLIIMALMFIGIEFDLDALTDGSGHVSLHGISGFFTIFGLVGLYLDSQGYGVLVSSMGGIGAGGVMFLAVSRIIMAMRNLESSGNITVDQTVGAKGSVYAEILPGESGAVTIFIDERERRYDAVTDEPAGLKTGDLIEVKEVISGSLLKVTKLTT
ncbi:MAG: hypothetical protein HN969_10600 [Verrucomicrobia bacterium]|nr:hypothetical protein [Verrucomicrobiota bacterium]MBT5621187.1 hypothetical protein [Verrucomicrobiota bacterium]MBT6788437.1 hypothetical protein [Verrucomicrobiota bacterium]MBT7027996.1 hypothetical protein [Verrucomicrobiota bacterium]